MILEKKGISVRIINIATVKPIDSDIIIKAAEETKNILTIEEHSTIGGLGSAVADIVATSGIGINFRKMGFDNCFCTEYGYHQELKKMYGLNGDAIAGNVMEMLS